MKHWSAVVFELYLPEPAHRRCQGRGWARVPAMTAEHAYGSSVLTTATAAGVELAIAVMRRTEAVAAA